MKLGEYLRTFRRNVVILSSGSSGRRIAVRKGTLHPTFFSHGNSCRTALKAKALVCLETSRNAAPTTQRHIPEDLNFSV